MRVEFLGKKGTWRDIADAARTTIGMRAGTGDPPSSWKRKMLIAEHSPIRQLIFKWKWVDIPYWISVHFVRHKIGIEHWVRTQRTGRTGVDRNTLPQGNLIQHECEANAQAIINISRKRLCARAHPETRDAWIKFLREIVAYSEPELYSVCVPECVYRGWCPEYKTCNYFNSSAFLDELSKYREGINGYKRSVLDELC